MARNLIAFKWKISSHLPASCSIWSAILNASKRTCACAQLAISAHLPAFIWKNVIPPQWAPTSRAVGSHLTGLARLPYKCKTEITKDSIGGWDLKSQAGKWDVEKIVHQLYLALWGSSTFTTGLASRCANIEVRSEDNYPKHLPTNCVSFNNSPQFSKTSSGWNSLFLTILITRQVITAYVVKRKLDNLVHNNYKHISCNSVYLWYFICLVNGPVAPIIIFTALLAFQNMISIALIKDSGNCW